jgi:hypothetical protein
VRLLAGPLGFIHDLPPEAKLAYAAFSVTPRSIQAWADEGTGMPESFAQADAVKTLGDVPLIVLTSGLNQQTDWQSMQVELLRLSSNSRQIITEKSGHNIEIEQPGAAVEAIVAMVSQLRK